MGLGLIGISSGCNTRWVSSENLHRISKQLVAEWKENTETYIELYNYAKKRNDKDMEQLLDDYIWDAMKRGNEYKGEFTILEEEWKGNYKEMLGSIDRTISTIQNEIYNK